jgi:hypothetical protein
MGGDNGQHVKLKTSHDGGTDFYTYGYVGEWTEVKEAFSPPLESTYNVQDVVNINHTGSLWYLYIDRITIDWDYIPAP